MAALVAIVVAVVIGVGGAVGASSLLINSQPNRAGYVPSATTDGTGTSGSSDSDIVQYGAR